MKKKIAVLLLAMGFALFAIGCELNDKEAPGLTRGTDSEQGLADEKIYWNGTIDEDFCGSSVIVMLDRNTGGVNKRHDESFFGDFEKTSVTDLTMITGDIKDTLISEENFRQTFEIRLPMDSKENVVNTIRQLERMEGVKYVHPNFILYLNDTRFEDTVSASAMMLSSITPYHSQWGLIGDYGIQVQDAWSITTGSSDVRVGIMDTGIADHPDLTANLRRDLGYNFTSTNTNTNDTYSHGTDVAGVIGGNGSNTDSVAGVCQNVSLVPLKIFKNGNDSTATITNAIRAIIYAGNINVKIINASWEWNSLSLSTYINMYDGLFVCAAGNETRDNDITPHYPGNFRLPNLISVGAINKKGEIRSDSNWGRTTVDIFAPGDAIYTTGLVNTRLYSGGTSISAPFVSGVAALILSIRPELSGAELKTIIMNNTPVQRDLTYPKKDLSSKCVSGGRLNASTILNNVVNNLEIVSYMDFYFNDGRGRVGDIARFYLYGDGAWAFANRLGYPTTANNQAPAVSLPFANVHLQAGPMPGNMATFFQQCGQQVSQNIEVLVPQYVMVSSNTGKVEENHHYRRFVVKITINGTGVTITDLPNYFGLLSFPFFYLQYLYDVKYVTIEDKSGVLNGFPGRLETIQLSAIPGVAVPVVGAARVTQTGYSNQYTGTVAWSPNHGVFQPNTQYTATISLSAKTNYTLQGVTPNFFTVAGATATTNAANTGVITAVFPATARTVTQNAIPGISAPAAGESPVRTINTAQYSGTVTWSPNHSFFQPSTQYTATISLSPKTGYTFHGVALNSFTVSGSASQPTNAANSGLVTAVFPATAAVNSLFGGGTGTSLSPYQIRTVQQLKNIGLIDTNGIYFVLAANINLDFVPWLPINMGEGFFNGYGYTISNLYIEAGSSGNYGLFASNDGTISNLTVSAFINIDNYEAYIGVIAGINFGNIVSCTTKNTIGNDYMVQINQRSTMGGIVGRNMGLIEKCTNNGKIRDTVSGSSSVIGGIAGDNFGGSIMNNTNNGGIFVGSGYSNLSFGGIVGWQKWGSAEDNKNSGIIVDYPAGNPVWSQQPNGNHIFGYRMYGRIEGNYCVCPQCWY